MSEKEEMENAIPVTSPTLAERFPIGKSVNTRNIIVGSTRNGIVTNYINDYPGPEFVVIKFPRGLAALPPEELQRNDLQHPRCPFCQCEKDEDEDD